jgi:hypothetical protein
MNMDEPRIKLRRGMEIVTESSRCVEPGAIIPPETGRKNVRLGEHGTATTVAVAAIDGRCDALIQPHPLPCFLAHGIRERHGECVRRLEML